MTELIDIDGGCFCGKVKLDAKVSKNMVLACHCRDCQIFSGGPFRMVIIVDANNLNIKGKTTDFLKVADSGNKRIQSFCGTCGSQLFASDDKKSIFSIRGGCISQHHELSPVKHIFGQSALSWIVDINRHSWTREGPNSEKIAPPSGQY